jgi:hypothetical protein
VTVLNTSPVQTHIVIDRFMNGHELRPGEKKEVEMLVDEIEAFRKVGRPNRGVYPSGPLAGQPLPPHPPRFIDLPAAVDAPGVPTLLVMRAASTQKPASGRRRLSEPCFARC